MSLTSVIRTVLPLFIGLQLSGFIERDRTVVERNEVPSDKWVGAMDTDSPLRTCYKPTSYSLTVQNIFSTTTYFVSPSQFYAHPVGSTFTHRPYLLSKEPAGTECFTVKPTQKT